MHEMQALLLELLLVALEGAGLVPALEELCRTYRDPARVRVDVELGAVALDPPAEHAVLRVVQEALANAVKHARPNRIGCGSAARKCQQGADLGDEVDDADQAEEHPDQ
jgi:signal transduction histidine kinase